METGNDHSIYANICDRHLELVVRQQQNSSPSPPSSSYHWPWSYFTSLYCTHVHCIPLSSYSLLYVEYIYLHALNSSIRVRFSGSPTIPIEMCIFEKYPYHTHDVYWLKCWTCKWQCALHHCTKCIAMQMHVCVPCA